MAGRVHEMQAACATDEKFGCTVLEVSVRSEDSIPTGLLKLRLAPGGVDAFISAASKGGKIAARGTHAEDLAQPVCRQPTPAGDVEYPSRSPDAVHE